MVWEEDFVTVAAEDSQGFLVQFVKKGEQEGLLQEGTVEFFDASFLKTAVLPVNGKLTLLVGMGEKSLDKMKVKELAAKAASECQARRIKEVSMDVSTLLKEQGVEAVRDITEGALLGNYCQIRFGEEQKEEKPCKIWLSGIFSEDLSHAKSLVKEAGALARGVMFARDMVNLPGNRLRPEEFARQVMGRMEGLPVECICYDRDKLKEMGMEALLAVGDSSEYAPCMMVLRYQGAPGERRITGLVGKGVTCDTGGYCLKAASSQLGIKGDMAGGAAVAGTIYALAQTRAKTNVTAVIPMVENRISSGSFLPGDVISSYAGKTIEIGNTDAEGRLILADAVAYAVDQEKVTEVLDIATLTGAVVGMLGFSIGGVLCDDESWYEEFQRAYDVSGERYLRIPFYEEHEKMIESELADVRNMSSDGCGTITAGLFIRKFAQGRPWLHLDIAGTAWVGQPVFAFQSKGATGAGVTTMYQLCCRKEK